MTYPPVPRGGEAWMCPKCGIASTGDKYSVAYRKRGVDDEYMHLQCKRCGYGEYRSPLDQIGVD